MRAHTWSLLYSCHSSLGQKAPCDSSSLPDASRTHSWTWRENGNRTQSGEKGELGSRRLQTEVMQQPSELCQRVTDASLFLMLPPQPDSLSERK